MNKLRLGYTVSNPILKNLFQTNISRTCRLKTIEKQGINFLRQKAIENITDLLKIMTWNYKENIFLFRMSTNLIPHISNIKLYDINHKEAFEYKTMNFLLPYFDLIRKEAENNHQRLTFHLPLYTKLASPDNNVFYDSIYTIEQYAKVLDIICPNGIMVIHIGGIYNDKEKTLRRWIYNYNERLSDRAKKYLALENDEFQYSLSDCLEINQETKVPIVADFFHHQCHEKKNNFGEYILPVLETWNGKRAKFHLSEQGIGKIGKHSENIKNIPEELLVTENNIDIMLEAKNSLDSLFFLRDKYMLLKMKN